MNKKYKLTTETKLIDGHTVYRIKAAAMQAAARDYTHAVGSGTYWPGVGVRSLRAAAKPGGKA